MAGEGQPDALFKIIIIGDSGVGKSCFLIQFTENDFKEDHNITIGVEYGAKMVNVSGKNIKLQIWDTAGQESFRAITRTFYRNANGVILMYDLTRQESFDNLDDWLREVLQNQDPDVCIYLVGNVLDLANEDREVTYEMGENFAKQHNLAGFMEASAKTAENVSEVFVRIAKILYDQQKQRESNEVSSNTGGEQLRPINAGKPKKKCC